MTVRLQWHSRSYSFLDYSAKIQATKLVKVVIFQLVPSLMLEFAIQLNLIFIFALMPVFRYILTLCLTLVSIII